MIRKGKEQKNKWDKCCKMAFFSVCCSSLTNLCTRALLCDCAMVNIVLLFQKSDKSDRGWGMQEWNDDDDDDMVSVEGGIANICF